MLVRKIFGTPPLPKDLVLSDLDEFPYQQNLPSMALRNLYRELDKMDDDISQRRAMYLARQIGDMVRYQPLTREQVGSLQRLVDEKRFVVAYETLGLIPTDSIAEKVLILPGEMRERQRVIFENGMVLDDWMVGDRICGYMILRTLIPRLG